LLWRQRPVALNLLKPPLSVTLRMLVTDAAPDADSRTEMLADTCRSRFSRTRKDRGKGIVTARRLPALIARLIDAMTTCCWVPDFAVLGSVAVKVARTMHVDSVAGQLATMPVFSATLPVFVCSVFGWVA
jgi:hypothetical protein